MALSKIEIITGMAKLDILKRVLTKEGVRGMTVCQVLGCGIERGAAEYAVDELEDSYLLPKQQVSIVVETDKVRNIIEVIKKELYTGHIGDGKMFIYSIDNAVRIRTGDEGLEAL